VTERDPPTDAFDIEAFIATLTSRPGVYRMLDAAGEVLYVGKAHDLKKRVSSYFRRGDAALKTRAMVAQVRAVEVTVTHTETEALLLENNLIKRLKPRYNILLRDDKSYPYIYLSSDEEFPRFGFHRGSKRSKGQYFGPYPSAAAVRETLNLLQKVFPVRQCENSYYRNRSRPCLQYQIKRCTAPCVGLVNQTHYAEDLAHAVMFLEGRSRQVVDELVARMEGAAAALEFERAAAYRDQIAALRRVQEKQYVSGDGGDVDVICATVRAGGACVHVLTIRGGRILGARSFYPQLPAEASPAEVLRAFLPQYYLAERAGRDVPREMLVSHPVEDATLLQELLEVRTGRKVGIAHRLRGDRARWMRMAEASAVQSLSGLLASRASTLQRLEALQAALGLDAVPQRLECFDISHTMGEAAVASCVVLDGHGPVKSDYRRYNIEGITPGDDYAAMGQALRRRYARLKEGEGKFPDVLLIDGGRGQVGAATGALAELQVAGVTILGVAKGPTRKPGLEELWLSGSRRPIILPSDSAALHLIQQIRDEAHRFAISGHRARRSKARGTSVLQDIAGVGVQRRRHLLQQLGGLQGVARAGVEDLARVPGISKQLAERIYDAFHGDTD
jgi:excinuclease ABC subunit C